MEAMVTAPDASLDLTINRIDRETIVIEASGSLDETTVASLRRRALGRGDNSPDRVLVDLSRIERIDAAGLAVLMLARIELEARGGAMTVFTAGARIVGVLERAGLRRFVDIAHSRAAALRMLQRGRV